MTPQPGLAPRAALPTAGHKTAPVLAAKSWDKTDQGNGIPGNAIRATGTTSSHDAAMTAPQKARAISKDPTDRNLAVAQDPTMTTAPPEGAATRQAGQAGATVGGAHNIPNCYSRGGSHVPTLHF